MMFDAHCHLQDAAFDVDREAMLAESRAAGVSHFLVPAADAASFGPTLGLASSQTNVFCALGIHPHSANEWNSEVRERIHSEVQRNERVVAIGEIGLDYHYDFSPRDVQRKAFAEQIALAIELQKPIVIHTRESEEDVFRIVEECYASQPPDAPRGQFHCFSAGVDWMQKAISLGFYVSFTGNITFKNSTLAEVVRETPLERLLIETDSPYLTPAPHRGKRNSPAALPFIAGKIAELKQLDISIIMQHTFENALRLFRIAPLLLAMMLLASASATNSYAQRTNPVGSLPPDSVLTGDRRKAEELRKKQEAELAKEAELHRQDSIKAAQKDQEEAFAKAREQSRQDSIHAEERLAEEEKYALFLQTLQPWKSIGVGFSAGVGNMQMAPLVLVSTTVFAYTVDASTQLTHRLDFDLSYSHMAITGPFQQDSIWYNGPGSDVSRPYIPAKDFVRGQTRLISSEVFGASWFSADFRYVFTRPGSYLSFYFGLGYMYMVMTNTQHYFQMLDDSITPSEDRVFQKSFDRSAIKVLFGLRHDFELGSGMTIEPFAQIATMAAFQGQQQETSFILGPARDLLVMTHFNVGFTLYYGWWGVPRQ